MDPMVKSTSPVQTSGFQGTMDVSANTIQISGTINSSEKKQEKKLPNSFKADLEGYRMTAAWARKQINQYGGEI